MDCDWFVHYFRLDSDRSTVVSLQKHIKRNKENVDMAAGQPPPTRAALEFRVLSFGNTHEHVVPHSLLRSTVCQVMSAFVS